MSQARTHFLSRICALIESLNISAVSNRSLTDHAHNEVARLLRNGLAVVGFAALEDFVKSRTSEVLLAIGGAGVPFRDLPERLRYATTFEAIHALSYQLNLHPKEQRVAYIQEHAQKIASTANNDYELTPHALGFDQANIQVDTVKSILKAFNISNPWGEMTRLASRIGLTALPLDETFKSAAWRRHRAAHAATADTPQADLIQFATDAAAIAISFDALISRALQKICSYDTPYLTGESTVSSASISIRTIRPSGAKWRELVEGHTKAVKVDLSPDNLLTLARQRAARSNDLLISFVTHNQIRTWECH